MLRGKLNLNLQNSLLKRKLLNVSRRCDRFVVLSEHMKNNLVLNKYPLDKIIKVYPVIKLKSDDVPRKDSSSEILFIGQIIRGKGVDLLLKALTYLKSDFKLNIVGKGNDEGFINSLISEYNLQDKVNMGWFYDGYGEVV